MNDYTTGLDALDTVIGEIEAGDNIIWRTDDIANYLPFAEAFVKKGLESGRKIVYFRFAGHPRVVPDLPGIICIKAYPEQSFESFIIDVHGAITRHEGSAFYIFDSLSDLSENYFSDRMIGNFFKLTCSYLSEKKTAAYFALYRYKHSYHAMDPISETTQIMIDVYRYRESLFVKPAKLAGEQPRGMYRVHEWRGEDFVPITSSALIAEVIASTPWTGLPSASYRMVGVWDHMFMRAEAVLEAYNKGQSSDEKVKTVFRQVLRLIISRDERIFDLAEANLSLADIIDIWKRMIGTGLIGGKSVGMLIARAILTKKSNKWAHLLEEHDSFFIASDVFYTFLVANGCWWDRQRQKNPDTFLDGNESVRKRILRGNFPDYILNRFSDMLDYYGYSPIIVRSSSLLEDNFGNAFAGKYESVFCANQGTKEERLEYFLNAVRLIYASTMSLEALSYRKNRGVLDRDEQMALLVQRVSGQPYRRYYFPQLAGVGFSFNPYAWNEEIDPEAGMIRLVFGLGTRAVDRADDDYTRVVALNAPEKRPESDFAAVKRYAQRRVDVLDLESNDFRNIHFTDLEPVAGDLPMQLFAVRDRELERSVREQGMKKVFPWVLTFDSLLKKTSLVRDMREMFTAIRDAYRSEVDIEFTANFLDDGSYRINLVQCRPLQIQEASESVEPLPELTEEQILMDARGATIGHSRKIRIERIIYVVPELYGRLAEKDRYAVAKLIGKVTQAETAEPGRIMLIGPGRWGTSTPSLGIPVSFREINNTSVLCEIDSMHEGLVPDLSLGTHFFNELVELNMLYVAYFVGREGNRINSDFFKTVPNQLEKLLKEEQKWSDLVKVLDFTSPDGTGGPLVLNANALEQRSVLYIE